MGIGRDAVWPLLPGCAEDDEMISCCIHGFSRVSSSRVRTFSGANCHVEIDGLPSGFSRRWPRIAKGWLSLGFLGKEYRSSGCTTPWTERLGAIQLRGEAGATYRNWSGRKQLGLGETEYCFNALPLGGYVKMLGRKILRLKQAGELAVKAHPPAFTHKPVAISVQSSPWLLMNLVFAASCSCSSFMWCMEAPTAEVGRVMPDSPAHRAGLQTCDIITHIVGGDIGSRRSDHGHCLVKPYEPAEIPFGARIRRRGSGRRNVEVRPETAPVTIRSRSGWAPHDHEDTCCRRRSIVAAEQQFRKTTRTWPSPETGQRFHRVTYLTANAEAGGMS
jgi:hypothetical protein